MPRCGAVGQKPAAKDAMPFALARPGVQRERMIPHSPLDDPEQAAHEAGADIAFEAAVAGGIPILRALREGLVANRFEKVMAILNA